MIYCIMDKLDIFKSNVLENGFDSFCSHTFLFPNYSTYLKHVKTAWSLPFLTKWCLIILLMIYLDIFLWKYCYTIFIISPNTNFNNKNDNKYFPTVKPLCEPNPCLNNGTCTFEKNSTTGEYEQTCRCTQGFNGTNCEIDRKCKLAV